MPLENVPLTPGAIPPPTFVHAPAPPLRRRAVDPLAFGPVRGVLFFLQLPGILIFSMVVAYIFGRLRLHLMLLLPIAHAVYFVLRRSAKAFSRSATALAVERARRERARDCETVEWLNYVTRKFWEVAEAGVSAQIYSIVNDELRKNTPSFLKSLKLTELTLGTRPPVVEKICFVEKTDETIVLEVAFNFIPVETSEDVLFYFGEERQHWNTRIELTAQLGFLRIPLLVRNLTFSAMVRAEIGLTRQIPFLKHARVSMLELPVVEFEILPLRAADLMDISLLSSFIHRIINYNVSQMLLYPKYIEIDLSSVADYSGATVGVVFVHVHSLESSFDESSARIVLSDPHGKTLLATDPQAGRDPLFNVGAYAVVTDTAQSLGIRLVTRGRSFDGESSFYGRIFLRNLNARHMYSERVCLSSETERRFVSISTSFFPLSKEGSTGTGNDLQTIAQQPSGEEAKSAVAGNQVLEKQHDSAIITFTLVACKNLQAVNCPKSRLYSTFAKIILETKECLRQKRILQAFESKRIFSSRDPFYNETVVFFVRNMADYCLRISINDEKSLEEIGSVVVPLDTVASSCGSSGMYRLSGAESGEAQLRFALAYVDMEPLAAKNGPFESCVLSTSSTPLIAASDDAMPSEYAASGAAGSRATLIGGNEVDDADNLVSVANEELCAGTQVENYDFLPGTAPEDFNKSNERNAAGSTLAVAGTTAAATINAEATATNQQSDHQGKQAEPLCSITQRLKETMLPSLALGIYNLAKPDNDFVHFTTAVSLSLCSISDTGAFYAVFETEKIQQRMEPFCTALPLTTSVLLPLTATDALVRARLFRMVPGGNDALVGETVFDPWTDSVLLFRHIRAEITAKRVHVSESEPETGDDEDAVDHARRNGRGAAGENGGRCRIVQLLIEKPRFDSNLGQFPQMHRGSVFSVEVYSKQRVVGYCVAGTMFRFVCSEQQLRGAVRENGRCLVSFTFDADTYEQVLDLGHGMTAKMKIKTLYSDYLLREAPSRGLLEVFVIKAISVASPGVVSSRAPNPYVKVYQNGEKVYKTRVKSGERDPMWHESFRISAEKDRDTLSFYLTDRDSIASSGTILGYCELPLLSLQRGYTRFELPMIAPGDEVLSTRLQLILNYVCDSETS